MKIIATFIITALFGTVAASAAGGISKAEYTATRVTLNGVQVPLKTPLTAITDASDPYFEKMYMPVRELLEHLGYMVVWDGENDTIRLLEDHGSRYTVMDDGTVIKNMYIQLGYQMYEIDLVENLELGTKWEYTIAPGSGITLEKDEYLTELSTDKQTVHRFYLNIPYDFPHSEDEMVAVTFEQTLDGKKTGHKIVYNVYFTRAAKPVIYLYPEEETEVSVTLDYNGRLDFTYPEYNGGWSVTAYPDGRIVNHADGQEYSYLFWEGVNADNYDFSKGFVVKREDTIAFLQEKLAYMGLLPKEYNEFIVYWAPKMMENPYNLVSFQFERYTDTAKLNVTPEPDSVLRVFMAYKPLKEQINIEPQDLKPFERKGFTVIEWGGGKAE